MSVTTRLGLGIAAAALVLGLLGDALLRVSPWGINLIVWLGSLVVAIVLLGRWEPVAFTGAGRWLVVPMLGFAAAYAWRDSATLNALNVLMLLTAVGLAAWCARAGRLRVAGLTDYALGLCLASLHAAGGALALVAGDIRWSEAPRQGWSRQATAASVGLMIACPPLLVFGSLFAAADPVFEHFAVTLIRWNLEEVAMHLMVATVISWTVAGLLRQALLGPAGWRLAGERPRQLALGIVEIGVALALIDALFLTFVIVQFRYFFGGATLVEVSPTLTYAEYARRGFFELVAVAALALPLLLLADWLLRPARAAHTWLFRVLAGTLVALLFIILISAVGRMRLYQAEFGLTELRLYTSAFMVWLALVLVWFVATVLRGRREQFAAGSLAAGFTVVALLNVVNPDALIVRVNLERLQAGQRFDTAYVTSLSADAVPTLVAALPALPADIQHPIAAHLQRRWASPPAPDWRTWNWARMQAQHAVVDGLGDKAQLSPSPQASLLRPNQGLSIPRRVT